jgi:hypothetical protein
MDVPCIDTSSLAVKRLAMQKVRPVGPKDQTSSDLRVAVRRHGEGDGSGSHEDEGGESSDEEDSHADVVETYDGTATTEEHEGGHLFDAMA